MITKPCRVKIQTLALVTPLALALPALAAAPATTNTPTARHHRHTARHRQMAAASPIHPFAPQPRPAPTDSAAPVPNPAVTAPIDNSDQQASVAPAVMQIHYPPQGDGYTSGSSAQAMDDREAAKVTGVLVKVPLGQ